MSKPDLASSTIRPTRHHSLADKSFFGKFASLADDYDALPANVADDDACIECDEVPDDSILNLPEPQTDLARRAEHMRSSLMSRRPGSSSHVTFAANSESVVAEPVDVSDDAAVGSKPTAASEPATSKTTGKAGRPPVRGSMMTHPPSRTVAVAGRVTNAAGHTFGSLPRASPSGTMAHHAPRAQPTPAATAALQRPRSARARLDGAEPTGSAASQRPATADNARPQTASRPSSARSEGSTRSSDGSRGGGAAASAFAVAAKGGALAWRHPEDATKPRVATKPPKRQELVRAQKAVDDADTASKKGAPFAFTLVCCGDEFEGYCCKRHHPADDVVCCRVHAPVRAASASSMTKSRDSIAERYKQLMRETAAHEVNTRWK